MVFLLHYIHLHLGSAMKRTVTYIYSETLENRVTPTKLQLLGQTVIRQFRNISFHLVPLEKVIFISFSEGIRLVVSTSPCPLRKLFLTL